MQPKPGEFCQVVLGDMTCLGSGYGEVADILADLVLTAAELREITPEQYKELYLLGDWNGEPNPFCRNLKGMIRSGELPYILWESGDTQVFLEFGDGRAILRSDIICDDPMETIIHAISKHIDTSMLDLNRLPGDFRARLAEVLDRLLSELVSHFLKPDGSGCVEYAWVSPATGHKARVILSPNNPNLGTLSTLPGWCQGGPVADTMQEQQDPRTLFHILREIKNTSELLSPDERLVHLLHWKSEERYTWIASWRNMLYGIQEAAMLKSVELILIIADKQTFKELRDLID